jgi:hypothetical protein
VAGLIAWGGARMEAALHCYLYRLGWATVALRDEIRQRKALLPTAAASPL